LKYWRPAAVEVGTVVAGKLRPELRNSSRGVALVEETRAEDGSSVRDELPLVEVGVVIGGRAGEEATAAANRSAAVTTIGVDGGWGRSSGAGRQQ
jgi:hypothetical protein